MKSEILCWICIASPGDPQFVHEIYGPMTSEELEEIERELQENPLVLATFPKDTGSVLCRVWPERIDDNSPTRWWNIEPVSPLRVEMVPTEDALFQAAQRAVES